jgi:hypothetical protein
VLKGRNEENLQISKPKERFPLFLVGILDGQGPKKFNSASISGILNKSRQNKSREVA